MAVEVFVGAVAAKSGLDNPELRENVFWRWKDDLSGPEEPLVDAFKRGIDALVQRGIMDEKEAGLAMAEVAETAGPLEEQIITAVRLGHMMAALEDMIGLAQFLEESRQDPDTGELLN